MTTLRKATKSFPAILPSTTPQATSTLLSGCASLPTPTYPSPGVFTVYTSIYIAAPPIQCLRTTLSPSTYSEWNSFVPFIKVNEQPSTTASSIPEIVDLCASNDNLRLGTKYTLYAYTNGYNISKPLIHQPSDPTHPSQSGRAPKGSTITPQICSVLGPIEDGGKGYSFCAHPPPGTFVGHSWAFWCERVQEFSEKDDGGTTYETWETFHGPLAYVVKLFVGGTLVKRFGDLADGLKAFCEAGGNAS